MDRYEIIEKIGAGTYAVVYRALDKATNNVVALKEIKMENKEGMPSTALREIAILRELNHPNIVRLIDVVHSDSRLLLIFESMHQDLKMLLDGCNDSENSGSKRILPALQIKSLLYQLISGLALCHKNHIIHRDLKPQNLLLDETGQYLKIADFGLARGVGVPVSGYSNEVVTLWYRAPDVLFGSSTYTSAIDMWSVGCIMGELYRGKPLFMGKDNEDQLKKIFKFLGTPRSNFRTYCNSRERSTICLKASPDKYKAIDQVISELPIYPTIPFQILFPNIEPDGIHLLKQLLIYMPESRITAYDALFHPYFHELMSTVEKR